MRNKGLMILKGLSPCVRGKLIQSTPNIKWSRSIPVCTGETHRRSSIQPAHRVYPRVYGGNEFFQREILPPEGLSPCVRGKRSFHLQGEHLSRSIPVCTGETQLQDSALCSCQVYPRVYGGNTTPLDFRRFFQGLSPCVRGKQELNSPALPISRSIPVCTGETQERIYLAHQSRVYPRVYGGNTACSPTQTAYPGLSPCVRGKQKCLCESPLPSGSIPVCTGETLMACQTGFHPQVYPRVYGGNP